MRTEDENEPEPLQVSIKTAVRLLGCCRQTLYKMRADGQITFGKMRSRAMVPMKEIHRVHALLYGDATQAIEPPVGEPPKPRVKKIQLNPQHSGM